mmetsp:Transcript_51121/g.118825  ORF Transcript_51121/g.118825 Transcript_51121/m.118825 type:complete len:210 (-) Transcript_51121:725-1354(-)
MPNTTRMQLCHHKVHQHLQELCLCMEVHEHADDLWAQLFGQVIQALRVGEPWMAQAIRSAWPLPVLLCQHPAAQREGAGGGVPEEPPIRFGARHRQCQLLNGRLSAEGRAPCQEEEHDAPASPDITPRPIVLLPDFRGHELRQTGCWNRFQQCRPTQWHWRAPKQQRAAKAGELKKALQAEACEADMWVLTLHFAAFSARWHVLRQLGK